MMPQTALVRLVPRGLTRPWRGCVALLAGLVLSVGVSLEAQAARTWTACASGCDYSRIKAAIVLVLLTAGALAIAHVAFRVALPFPLRRRRITERPMINVTQLSRQDSQPLTPENLR